MCAVMVYFFYNHYCYIKYLILSTIIDKEDYYNENFKLRKQYLQIYLYTSPFCCCCKKAKLEQLGEDSGFEEKMETYGACEKLLNNRLSIENFINEGMEMQIIRGMILKERHKLL